MEKPPYTSLVINLLLVSSITILLLNHACLLASAQALCPAQIALANEACSFIKTVGPGHIGLNSHGPEHDPVLEPLSDDHPGRRHYDHHHHHGPHEPILDHHGHHHHDPHEPILESFSNHDHHGHHHHHRRRHHHNARNTACCRRLEITDNACVCELLGRLPAFIRKPNHVLTLRPHSGCDVSFQCDGF